MSKHITVTFTPAQLRVLHAILVRLDAIPGDLEQILPNKYDRIVFRGGVNALKEATE